MKSHRLVQMFCISVVAALAAAGGVAADGALAVVVPADAEPSGTDPAKPLKEPSGTDPAKPL